MKQISCALGLIAVLGLGGCGDPKAAHHSTLPPGIGDVDVVLRTVHGTLANQDIRRVLAVQDDVYWRELIETGQESATEVEFADGTRLTVGADAKVNLDEFVYGGPPGTDRMVMTVTKGMSRFVTGSMDKAAYEIRAPGAIIGVRGTEFTLVVDPDTETTLCVVHRGEVEFRRPNGGSRVIIQPGEASRASARPDDIITPAAPPPVEVIRSAETLRSTVETAKREQAAMRTVQQTAAVTDADRRASAPSLARNPFGRDQLQDFMQRLRTNQSGNRAGSTEATAHAPAATAIVPASTKATSGAGRSESATTANTVSTSAGGTPRVSTETVVTRQPVAEERPAQPQSQTSCGATGCGSVPLPDLRESPVVSRTHIHG